MRPRRRYLLVGMALTAISTMVFVAYLNPHLAVELANAVWACF
jgi:hypothetical protein